MNLSFAIRDEKGKGGQVVSIHQGEIKTLDVYWFDATGCPYVFPTITALVVKISQGSSPSLSKTLAASQVTLINSDTLNGKIGVRIPLSAADTALPVSSTLGMSVTITNSTTSVDELDLPNVLNVSAPLVL